MVDAALTRITSNRSRPGRSDRAGNSVAVDVVALAGMWSSSVLQAVLTRVAKATTTSDASSRDTLALTLALGHAIVEQWPSTKYQAELWTVLEVQGAQETRTTADGASHQWGHSCPPALVVRV